MRKIIAAAATSLALSVSTSASAIIVGGIDFGTLGLTQELETTTLGETFVNGVGQTLTGYGLVTSVNGDTTYCANGTSNCSLYFFFTGYTVSFFNGSQIEFTGGDIKLYYSGAPAINLLGQSSPADIAFITSQTPWAELTGHTFTDPVFNATAGTPGATYTLNGNGVLTGASISENGEGLVDVALNSFGIPAVQNYLNGNGVADGLGGFADKTLTSSSNNLVPNPFDVCSTPPVPGQFCLQGTLNVRGLTSVPEPATLTLLGVGLAGLGFVRRRQSLS
jgi:hypothetical protein